MKLTHTHRTVRMTARADAPADGLAWFRMTTEIVDRHDSVFYVSGVKLEKYLRNPVVLIDHENSVRAIAGRVEKIEVVNEGGVGSIDVGLRFAETESEHDAGSLAARLYRAGFLTAMSHRFNPLRWRAGAEITADERARWPDLSKWGYIVDEWELEEVSLVGLGSNPSALKRACEDGLLKPGDLDALKVTREPVREATVTVTNDAVLAALADMREQVLAAVDAVAAEVQSNHTAQMAAIAANAKAASAANDSKVTIETQKKLREIADQIHAACTAAS